MTCGHQFTTTIQGDLKSEYMIFKCNAIIHTIAAIVLRQNTVVV